MDILTFTAVLVLVFRINTNQPSFLGIYEFYANENMFLGFYERDFIT